MGLLTLAGVAVAFLLARVADERLPEGAIKLPDGTYIDAYGRVFSTIAELRAAAPPPGEEVSQQAREGGGRRTVSFPSNRGTQSVQNFIYITGGSPGASGGTPGGSASAGGGVPAESGSGASTAPSPTPSPAPSPAPAPAPAPAPTTAPTTTTTTTTTTSGGGTSPTTSGSTSGSGSTTRKLAGLSAIEERDLNIAVAALALGSVGYLLFKGKRR